MKNQSDQIGELFAALAKAQGVIAGAAKDSNNPFFKSRYADLASVWNACREALSTNGLSVVQTTEKDEHDELQLKTTLGHSSGQWMSSFLPIKIKAGGKNELQELGACLTYLRRYALSAIAGIAPEEDDDGNSGTNFQASRQKQKIQAEPEEEEYSEQGLTGYFLENWPEDRSQAREYMKEICDSKGWTFKKFIKLVHKDNESLIKTKDNFNKWKIGKDLEKVGI